jgi:hypothetical protein
MLITMYCAGPDVAINFAFSPRLDILSASFVTPPAQRRRKNLFDPVVLVRRQPKPALSIEIYDPRTVHRMT